MPLPTVPPCSPYISVIFIFIAVRPQLLPLNIIIVIIAIGDTVNSYAYDGNRVRKWNVSTCKYGEAWLSGDVIGCTIDLDLGVIEFYRQVFVESMQRVLNEHLKHNLKAEDCQ